MHQGINRTCLRSPFLHLPLCSIRLEECHRFIGSMLAKKPSWGPNQKPTKVSIPAMIGASKQPWFQVHLLKDICSNGNAS